MRVIIDASIQPRGHVGGVEQFIQGLVWSLGRLEGDDEYVVVALDGSASWLKPFIGPNQILVQRPAPTLGSGESLKRMLGPLRRPLGEFRSRIKGNRSEVQIPRSDGFLESLRPDIVHFPHQSYIRCGVPVVYNPHDLQHLHFPEFFSPAEVARRNAVYMAGCRESSAVVTESVWALEDVRRWAGLEAEKCFVVLMGAPTLALPAMTREQVEWVSSKFDLKPGFAIYPAQTWPHKNHLNLLEAFARLRKGRLDLHLVCTGTLNEHWPLIADRLKALELSDRVRFLGFVEPQELRALYSMALFTIYPSLLEGGGLPVVESMAEGIALACSSIPPVREYAGDAALFFDPHSPEDIARAAQELAESEPLRSNLIARGRRRVDELSWPNVARAYREIYRFAAGQGSSPSFVGAVE